MLFLDGVYIDGVSGSAARFRWVKAPTSNELTQLTHTIAQRIARFLERQGLLEREEWHRDMPFTDQRMEPRIAIWRPMQWMMGR